MRIIGETEAGDRVLESRKRRNVSARAFLEKKTPDKQIRFLLQ
jgi:hypothetical protein